MGGLHLADLAALSPRPAASAQRNERLWRVILHDVYQKPVTIWSGPVLRSAQHEGGRAILGFDHATGLKAASGELQGFAIAGADQKFVWAKAVVSSDSMRSRPPCAMRGRAIPLPI